MSSPTIAQMFAKDISRPINGVVKADQTDNSAAWQELDEYVVTYELARHFRGFFDAYLKAIDSPKDVEITGAVGVWISGFFGSGKSHFLKILSYLLENRAVTHDGITKHALEFFEGKFSDSLLAGDVKRAVAASAGHTDVLLFNIDSKASTADGRAAILNVFWRVFSERAGYSGDYPHIAAIERRLDIEGKLDDFHAAFEREHGESWLSQRDSYAFFVDELARALSSVTGQSVESCRLMVEAKDVVISPENFALWVRDYLDRKGPNQRVFFLVDEIGQFIGNDTHLMLSLQTITENLGSACAGRAWVGVTSQENMDSIVGEIQGARANDFSKIQGRFKTRLSLSSANTDEVIQKRLLLKTDEANQLLHQIFAAKGEVLRTQTRFQDVGHTYAALDGAQGFAASYPFLPYQFELMQSVFEQIRKFGVTGAHISKGERSMLEAFKIAAEDVGNQAPDLLVPLHRFYPSIENFLDTPVKSTIISAANRGLDTFEVELLKTLFLIRYIDKFQGNIENLTTLCLDQIDADRIALRGRIESALLHLENETLVARNGEEWYFLTNEERDVASEIKTTEFSPIEATRKLSELLFRDVLQDRSKHRYSANKKDFGFNRYCDGAVYKAELEANELKLVIISPLHDEYELYNEARCVLESGQDHSLLLKLETDEKLATELRAFLKTAKYVARNSDASLPSTMQRIIRERADENHARNQRLIEMVKAALENATATADGQLKNPTASGVDLILNELWEELIRNSFSKLGLLAQLKVNPQTEITPTLRASDVAQLTLDLQNADNNPLAMQEVREHIARLHRTNQPIVLDELVKRFEKRPYGWPEWETVLIVARLLRIGEISLLSDGATIAAGDATEILNRQNRWRTAILQQRKTLDVAALQSARALANTLFSQMGPTSEGELSEFVRGHLEKWSTELNGFASMAQGGDLPGAQESALGLSALNPLLAKSDSAAFIEAFLERADKLKDLEEDYDELGNFHRTQKATWNKMRAALREWAPNETELNRDTAAHNALRQLHDIAANPRPYSQIRQIDALLGSVSGVNTALIEAARNAARAPIERAITQIETELEATQTPAATRGVYLEELRALQVQIGRETVVGNIFQAQSHGEKAKDAALEKLEIAASRDSATPAPKPRRVILAKTLVNGTYLEDAGAARGFVDRLSAEIMEAIEKGERVEIR